MAGADRMAIEEVVRKVLVDEHADVLRESVKWLARQLMEVEVSELIGAERGERTEDRATHRNGYRSRRWDTRAGEIELRSPRSVGAATSRVSWRPASAQSRRCCRSSSRPMCAA
jgi:putative transposase